MNLSITDFWIPKLQVVKRNSKQPTPIQGWQLSPPEYPAFVEADLELRPNTGELSASIWFVAAPGAVGKSTLARQISAKTGAAYLDLASAETVAGNYLTGGLVKNSLLSDWGNNAATVLIDALDEARLRVTQKSFEDFLTDVFESSRGRPIPTVLFGRVSIIEEAWLIVSGMGLECPIIDIRFFEKQQARAFVMAALDRLAKSDQRYHAVGRALTTNRAAYENAAGQFIERLEEAAPEDGSRFAGYAPVLEAVATVLALENNAAKLDTRLIEERQNQVLQDLTSAIMDREAQKLREQLQEVPLEHRDHLYDQSEQFDRLARQIFRLPPPPSPAALPVEHSATYTETVSAFLPQHPFLDGTDHATSNLVFSAAITAAALTGQNDEVRQAANAYCSNGRRPPNPFLFDFYLPHLHRRQADDEGSIIPPEHTALLYESVSARAEAGTSIRMSIDGDEDDESAEFDIEILIDGEQDWKPVISCITSQAGQVVFTREVRSVFVDAPMLDVVIGEGNPVELVAPTAINVGRLSIRCSELAVRAPDKAPAGGNSVTLAADKLRESTLVRPPSVFGHAELQIAFPGMGGFPWAGFGVPSTGGYSDDIEEPLRRFAKLVIAFRSHSKGSLKRLRDKLDHERMSKGSGGAVRRALLRDGVLKIEGKMYTLDPDRLGEIVGASFHDARTRSFSEKTIGYIANIDY